MFSLSLDKKREGKCHKKESPTPLRPTTGVESLGKSLTPETKREKLGIEGSKRGSLQSWGRSLKKLREERRRRIPVLQKKRVPEKID